MTKRKTTPVASDVRTFLYPSSNRIGCPVERIEIRGRVVREIDRVKEPITAVEFLKDPLLRYSRKALVVLDEATGQEIVLESSGLADEPSRQSCKMCLWMIDGGEWYWIYKKHSLPTREDRAVLATATQAAAEANEHGHPLYMVPCPKKPAKARA